MRNQARRTASELAYRVSATLGFKLTAYLAGGESNSDVHRWIADTKNPPPLGAVRRLYIADAAIAALGEFESRNTLQTLFQGIWPELGDRSPLAALRNPTSIRDVHKRMYIGVKNIINGSPAWTFNSYIPEYNIASILTRAKGKQKLRLG